MDSKRAISTTDTTTSFSSLHTSTGTSNSRGKGSRQQLSRSKEDSDEQQRRRDNSEKKRKDTKSVSGGSSGSSSKQKAQNSSSPLQNSPQSSTNQFSSRYYYREVPPRFQLQKHPPSKQSQPTQSQHSSSKQSKPNQSTKKPKETGSRWQQHNPDTSSHWPMDADNSSSSVTTSRAPGGSSSSFEPGVRRSTQSAIADKDPTSYRHLGKGGWGGGGDDSGIWGSQQSSDHKMATEQWTLSDENSPTEQNRADGEHMSGSENGRHAPLEWDEDLSEGSDKDTFTTGPPSRSKTFPRDMARMGEDKSILSRHSSDSEASRDFASSTHSLRDAVDSRTGIEGSLGEGGGWRMQHSRGSIGSTSSVNSVGSNSSWRNTRAGSNGSGGGGGGNYPRSTSPRKNSSNFVAGKSSGRFSVKGKKPSLDLHAADSLNDAPNGWGELPSPHSTNLDTGTEVWGIPEDVKKRMSQGGWGDRMPTAHRWGDGWNQNGNDKSLQNPSWGNGDTGAVNRGPKKEIVSHENIKKLVDMGFNYEQCEKALKINHNNLEDALGDLLTINALPQDDPMATFGSSPLIARKHPNTLNGAHLKPSYSTSSAGSISSAISSSATTPHTLPGSLGDQQAVTHHNQLSMSGQVTPGVQPQINHLAHHQSKHLQQDISHKLARLQHMKQSIAMQLSQHKSSQPHQANQQQLLSLQLSQVNANISSLNQQLLLVSQSQYKGPSRNGGSKPTDFKSMNGMQSTTGGYNSHSDQLGYQSPQGGAEMNGLSYNLQKMSVDSSQPSYSQQSAQSMSRLQQIISGPVDLVDRDGNRALDELSRPSYHTVSSPMMRPTSEQPSCFPQSTSSSHVTTSSTSSSFVGKGNMVDDIPEFKPGVPWQPRSQTKESSQTFGNSLGYNPTSSSSYLSPSDSKFAASKFAEESDSYFQATHDSSYRSSFTAGNRQMGGASFDSQQQYGSGYSAGRGVYRDRASAQRGGRNGRGSYAHGGQSSGQFGMLQSSQQRGHYIGRGQQPPHSSQSQYTGLGAATNGYAGGPSQGFNQPRIPRGFDSPSSTKKWNSDSSNPWSNKPFPGGNIWGQNSFSPAPPSDGYLSQELPYSEWKPASTPTQQPASISASLHAGTESSSPSSWLIIKNVSQIDETSLREVCSEYGQVLDCRIRSSSDSAVICYSSAEGASMAIAGLQKNPVICGVAVKPRFASEADLSAFFVNPKTSSSKASSSSWLPEPATPSPSYSQSSSQPTPLSLSSSTWGPPALGGFSSASMSGSSVESPSSVWGTGGSDEGGLLTGMVPNPWATSSQRPHQDLLQQEEAANYSTSPSLSTLLPNGLF